MKTIHRHKVKPTGIHALTLTKGWKLEHFAIHPQGVQFWESHNNAEEKTVTLNVMVVRVGTPFPDDSKILGADNLGGHGIFLVELSNKGVAEMEALIPAFSEADADADLPAFKPEE